MGRMSEKPEEFDPYQEFFDYLVEEGATPGDAWDAVWENPRLSATLGTKLACYKTAMHVIQPSQALAA